MKRRATAALLRACISAADVVRPASIMPYYGTDLDRVRAVARPILQH
jgi:hypothetical protein